MTIIKILTQSSGQHLLESQSHRTECWMDGWIAVPPELEESIWACSGFCDLTIEDGVLTGITPTERPEPEPEPEPAPTLDQRVSTLEATKAEQADVDELNEALSMILTGYTGEEAADETGA